MSKGLKGKGIPSRKSVEEQEISGLTSGQLRFKEQRAIKRNNRTIDEEDEQERVINCSPNPSRANP